MKNQKKQVSLWLSEENLPKFKIFAIRYSTNLSRLVERALLEYITKIYTTEKETTVKN